MEAEKTCIKCQSKKPKSDFYRAESRDGLMGSCKECHKAYVRFGYHHKKKMRALATRHQQDPS